MNAPRPIPPGPWQFIPGANGSFRIEAPGAGIDRGTLLLAQRGPVYTLRCAQLHAIGQQMAAAGQMHALLQRLVQADLTQLPFSVHGEGVAALLAYKECIDAAAALLQPMQPLQSAAAA